MKRRKEVIPMDLEMPKDGVAHPKSGLGFWVRVTDLITDDAVVAALPWCAGSGYQRTDSVDEALSRSNDDFVLVFNADPLLSIASRLDRGELVEVACSQWRAETETLLSQMKRERNRVAVVDVRMLFDEGHPKWPLLYDRLGITEHAATKQIPVSFKGPTAFSMVLAGAIIESDPDLTEFAEEMRALMAGSGASISLPLIKAAAAKLDDSYAEIGLLRNTLSTQLNLEAEHASAIETSRETLRRELAISERQRAVLKSTIASMKEEILNLKLQHKQDDARIAELGDEIEKNASALLLTRNELDLTRNELVKVFASKSWRLTSPLRLTRRRLGILSAFGLRR